MSSAKLNNSSSKLQIILNKCNASTKGLVGSFQKHKTNLPANKREMARKKGGKAGL